jgi:hypothetical protein
VLEVEPAAFRKRLQRARERLGAWMDKHCGIVNALNACNCRRQVPVGLAIGAIDPKALQFADHPERAPSRRIKLATLTEAADSVERARATLCNCPDYAAPPSIGARLRALIDSGTVRLLANSILVLCAAGLAACGAAAPRQVADTSQVADTADVAAHRRAYALFSAHDEAMFTLFADDIVEHQAPAPCDRRQGCADSAQPGRAVADTCTVAGTFRSRAEKTAAGAVCPGGPPRGVAVRHDLLRGVTPGGIATAVPATCTSRSPGPSSTRIRSISGQFPRNVPPTIARGA